MKLFRQLCAVALFACSSFAHSFNIFQAIREDNSELVQAWLDYRPDLEIRNAKGYTPLIQAVLSKRYEMVCWLLNAGANKYAMDVYGNTAYDYAVVVEQDTVKQREKEFALAMMIVADLLKSIELHNKYMHEVEWMQRGIPSFKPYGLLYYPLYKYPELNPVSSLLK